MSASQPASSGVSRVAALVLAALATGAAILGFAGALNRPSPEFAGIYAALRATAANRAANVYDIATLAQLNAAHGYASGALYPFSYPPFMLAFLRPLAYLPYEAARVVWLALVFLALLGAAALLADAYTHLARRRTGSAPSPLLPYAIAAAALLAAVPLADALYWGQGSILVVLVLALAAHAVMRGNWEPAGIAVGLAGGFATWQPVPGGSAVAVLALLALLLVGRWWAALWGLGALVIVTLLALLAVSPESYTAFASQQAFFGNVYATNPHNTALNGLIANVLTITEHTNTSGMKQALETGGLLGIVVAVVALVAAIVPALVGVRAPAAASASDTATDAPQRPARDAGALFLPLLALALTIPLLVAPVVWPGEAALAPFAALLLLGYTLAAGWRGLDGGLVRLLALLALACCTVAALTGSDAQNLPQGEPVLLLYLLRPLAGLLVWAGALLALLGIVVGRFAAVRSRPGAQRKPVAADGRAAA